MALWNFELCLPFHGIQGSYIWSRLVNKVYVVRKSCASLNCPVGARLPVLLNVRRLENYLLPRRVLIRLAITNSSLHSFFSVLFSSWFSFYLYFVDIPGRSIADGADSRWKRTGMSN